MKDPRLAVPSVAIPYGQRFITMDLCSGDELVGVVPRGANANSFSDAARDAGGAFTNPENNGLLTNIELYINNIFVNPEVHNIFIKRIGFSLIRVHRQQDYVDNAGGTTSLLLQNLKWPIEALFIGMRMADYTATTGVNARANLDKWHTFSKVVSTERTDQGWAQKRVELALEGALTTDTLTAVLAADGVTITGLTVESTADSVASAVVAAAANEDLSLSLAPGDVLNVTVAGVAYALEVSSIQTWDGVAFQKVFFANDAASLLALDGLDIGALGTVVSVARGVSAAKSYHVAVCTPNMSKVTVKAHGIPIYNDFPAGFFNAYVPLNYGGHNIRTPKDCGALMVTFCLYPGTYQPSGHINVSRAREFYLDYTTTANISNTAGNAGSLVIVASAINFLLISDGSAVLRYST